MLLTLFTVLINDTDGINISTILNTACEKHKQNLLQATSTGFQDIFCKL